MLGLCSKWYGDSPGKQVLAMLIANLVSKIYDPQKVGSYLHTYLL